jgi:hypothetical protein
MLGVKGHVQRVKKLIDGTTGTIVLGGTADAEDNFVSATMITDPGESSSLTSVGGWGFLFLVSVLGKKRSQRHLSFSDSW